MKHTYLIDIQFLGYRYHGWQKQPKVKTVQFMVEKTIAFIYEGSSFKTIGSSRTDSKVSANLMAFHLSIDVKIDESNFLSLFNKNLPNDIRVLDIKKLEGKINILDYAETKHYIYLFAHGEKPHPFSAALIHTEFEKLDISLMQAGAKLFEGEHNFQKYCTKPSPDTNFNRIVDSCEIKENTVYIANFFPKRTYALHIKSKGFMRYQIRLIMGQLFELGKHNITLDDIKNSLAPKDHEILKAIAPGSALILHHSEFKPLLV